MRNRNVVSMKFVFFTFAAMLMILTASCDDSGVSPPGNTGEFSTNLKPIDKNIEGV